MDKVTVIRVIAYEGTVEAVRKALSMSKQEGHHAFNGYSIRIATHSSNLPPAVSVSDDAIKAALNDAALFGVGTMVVGSTEKAPHEVVNEAFLTALHNGTGISEAGYDEKASGVTLDYIPSGAWLILACNGCGNDPCTCPAELKERVGNKENDQ